MTLFEQLQGYFSSLSQYYFFDKVISLGSTCQVAHQLNRLGYRVESYPFDWLFSTDSKKVIRAFKHDFKDWCLEKNLREMDNENYDENTCRRIVDSKYDMIYQHHFPLSQSLNESYETVYKTISRRVDRLLALKNSSQRILFVRTNTDEKSALKLGKCIENYGSDSVLLVVNHTKKFEVKYLPNVVSASNNVIMVEIYDENENTGQDWRGYNYHWDCIFNKIKLNVQSVDLANESMFEGFYPCECEGNSHIKFRWMSKEAVIHLEQYGGKKCSLIFSTVVNTLISIYDIYGKKVDEVKVDPNSETEYSFIVTHETRYIKLSADNTWQPAQYHLNDDVRELSIRVKKIDISNIFSV